MEYIAHIRQSDHQWQTVRDHLLQVKELCEAYGEKLGVPHLTGLAGMLHDLGKYTLEFRNYILEAVNDPDNPPARGSVDHSTAGGKLLYELFHTKNITFYKGLVAEVVGNAIISHHSYLHDFLNPNLESDYLRRVRDKPLEYFAEMKQLFFEEVMSEDDVKDYVEKAASEIEAFLLQQPTESNEKKLMFLTKFVFSTLIDADRTNTRQFEENQVKEEKLDHQNLMEAYYEKLMSKIQVFKQKEDADTPMNRLRAKMSDQCDSFAEKPSGIYTLSIPTGGGKTLASLRYALKHAKLYQKKRIIYVVPFTTIIEQNAQEVRKILEDDVHILEHHSNVIEDVHDDDESQDGMMTAKQKLKLARDNWDSPIIFTTMVQFLDVFYAKGSRNIRRLHNLCEAVIIFDEVQKLPVSTVSLFNNALNFLKWQGKSCMILCTATQPALDFVKHKLEVNQDAEIIENLDQIINEFKRVEIINKATDDSFDNEKLVHFLQLKIEEVQSILVILNTKAVVRNLYQRLKESDCDISIYHLSTSMCAAHRNQILEEVREHLKSGRKMICISTQLIEAGVDVSFDCVIRSLAGLDSIAQAAGRCNRHGEKEIRNVYMIDHQEENLNHLKEIKVGKKITKKILKDIRRDPRSHGGSILSRQAMDRYFKEFYTEFATELNYFIPELCMEMTELLTAPKSKSHFVQEYKERFNTIPPLLITNSYKTAADHFRVIDDQTFSMIVPFGDQGKEVIVELSSNRTSSELSQLLKTAQQFIVNVNHYEKKKLEENGGIVRYYDGKILALKEGAYHHEFGLDLENDSPLELSLY